MSASRAAAMAESRARGVRPVRPGGDTCQTIGSSAGSLSCGVDCKLAQTACCASQCVLGSTRCTSDQKARQVCRDVNGDGCFEWAADVSCACVGSSCVRPSGCPSFGLNLHRARRRSKSSSGPPMAAQSPEVPITVDSGGGSFAAPDSYCAGRARI